MLLGSGVHAVALLENVGESSACGVAENHRVGLEVI